MNVRPPHDRVLVQCIETEERVRGGIIIPDCAKEKPQEADVAAVGPSKVNDDGSRFPMDVEVGDRVLIGKYSGSEIKIEDEDFLILREDEIYGVTRSSRSASPSWSAASPVIDPAMVTKTALANVTSIAALILTTEAMVSKIPEKESAGDGMGAGSGMVGMSLMLP